MNETPVQPQANRSAAEIEALRAQVSSLRRWFHLAVASLLVLVTALNIYLFSQVRHLRAQNRGMAQHVGDLAKAWAEYETNSVPLMDRFTTELYRFASTHPDFAARMAKFPRPQPKGGATNAPSVNALPGQ